MNSLPTVSVVIPFHSNESWLATALESVRAQTVPVAEVIIICDGCGCDLTGFMRADPRVTIITTVNRGPGRARNLGIESAHSEYIAFLDSDDVWEPRKVEYQLTRMVETGLDWSHTSYSTFRDGAGVTPPLAVISSGRRHQGRIYPTLLSSCSIATPTVMIRAAVLREDVSLRFAGSMRYGEDAYMWARLAVSHPVLGIDSILTRVRIRGANASMNPQTQLCARAALWREVLNDPAGFPQEQISFLARSAFWMSSLASAIHARLVRRVGNEAFRVCLASVLYAAPWWCFRVDSWLAQPRVTR